jgi:hypothetical protein
METEIDLCGNGFFWSKVTCSDEEQCGPLSEITQIISRKSKCEYRRELLIAGDSAPKFASGASRPLRLHMQHFKF